VVTVHPRAILSKKADFDFAIEKPYICLTGCLEHLCAGDEIPESWCVEDKLIEERYVESIKERCIDSGHDVLQVLAIALKVKGGEGGEDDARQVRQKWILSIGLGSRGSEFKANGLEPCQCGETSDHRLGRNISGMGNIMKVELDEVMGRQE